MASHMWTVSGGIFEDNSFRGFDKQSYGTSSNKKKFNKGKIIFPKHALPNGLIVSLC